MLDVAGRGLYGDDLPIFAGGVLDDSWGQEVGSFERPTSGDEPDGSVR